MSDDLSPIYYRVSPAIWRQRWPEPTRYLALYLLTCQHRTAEGLFVLPVPYICADLKWSPERLAQPFKELIDDGFLDYDNETDVCLIVKALSYQPPANPNMIKAAVRRVATVPKSSVDEPFLRSAIQFAEPFAERLRERLPERFAKPQLFSALLNSALDKGKGPVDNSTVPALSPYCPSDGATLAADGHCPVCGKGAP